MRRPSLHRIGLAALFIIAAVLMWRMVAGSYRRQIITADGRQLTIRQVTFGTHHKFVYGSVWAKLLGPALPASWTAKGRLRTFEHKTQDPVLVIWGDWLLEPKASQPAPMSICSDANSTNSEFVTAGTGWTSVTGKGRVITTWTITNFPRRARSLKFQVCDWDASYQLKPVATYNLPNPARKRYTKWPAERYPMLRETNGITFRMDNFRKGRFISQPWMSIFPGSNLSTGYVALFEVKQPAGALAKWKVEHLTITDATGNRVDSRLQPSIPVGDYIVFGLNTTLWSSEKTWNFRTEFTRTSGFRSNELCTIKGIPVVTSDGPTQMVTSAQANGVSIIAIKMRRISGGPLTVIRIAQNIELEPLLAAANTNPVVKLVGAIDDRGRNLAHDISFYKLEPLNFGVALLPDSQSFDLTFAVQEPVSLEFRGSLSP